MTANLEKAKEILALGGYTCALCKGEEVYTSTKRGVLPLVVWLENNADFHGFSVADKVVGKGAAFLYLLLGVDAVYAHVISKPAFALLQQHGIEVEYDEKTEHIINRKGDGFCPFELAVMGIDDAKIAYFAIRKKLQEMNVTF